MAKLWGGRFAESSAKILEEFNASIHFDKELYKQDIFGSKIHAKMLNRIGILSDSEKNFILGGLDKIQSEIENGEFSFKIADEDIHMAIERRLVQLIGDVGKKLHTARSRNDQVALDTRLYVNEQNLAIQGLLKDLIATLLNIAKNHTATIMPGMTHLQHAQPVSFAFHILAYCFAFRRDILRLKSDYERNDFCPLGSAALAGSPYKIDREFCARELGFSAPSFNAMDSVSERDFALDLLYAIAMIMMHTSRLSEELILWSSSEFRFITISDSFATGSSIMPNKKNPDVPELIRGKSGRIYGNLIALLTTMKALPLAYNKDMQEDKEALFDSVKNASICLRVLNAMLKEIKINADSMMEKAKVGHLSATDLADFLVQKKGVSFRDAHHIVGKVVAFAESRGKDISELDDTELESQDIVLCGARGVLDLQTSLNSRNSYGGSAEVRVKEQIDIMQDFLDSL